MSQDQVTLTPRQEQVFRFLLSRQGEFFRPRQVQLELDVAGGTVRRVLIELREQKKIVHLPERHLWTVEARFYRYSYGIKWLDEREELLAVIPVHRKYYGALVQAWSDDAVLLDRRSAALQALLLRELESFLGYRQGEWWFFVDFGEGLQPVRFQARLQNRYEWRIEDDDGSVVEEGSGDLDRL